jgi:prolyl-tRNA editing enzyme YbaK/EbsC (Cys-tRNA(Pro) deacylase)
VPLWVDARVLTRSRVVLGGGSRRWKVLAEPRLLTAVARAEVVDGLAAPLPPAG